MLKVGNTQMKWYLLKDLEKITLGDSGNAYHLAKEWYTDAKKTEKAGKKKY